jgi:hypothetical protein
VMAPPAAKSFLPNFCRFMSHFFLFHWQLNHFIAA